LARRVVGLSNKTVITLDTSDTSSIDSNASKRFILTALITLVTILVTPGATILDWQFTQNSFASQTEATLQSQQQPLSIYQPIQDIPWEGQFVSSRGIAYFSPEEVTDGYLMRYKI
jgi:hypothetical protein